jgi:hypothetical protein
MPASERLLGVEYELASTEILPERDLTPSGVFHAWRNGVAGTVCGLELGREVRLYPGFPWARRGRDNGEDCPVCAAAAGA